MKNKIFISCTLLVFNTLISCNNQNMANSNQPTLPINMLPMDTTNKQNTESFAERHITEEERIKFDAAVGKYITECEKANIKTQRTILKRMAAPNKKEQADVFTNEEVKEYSAMALDMFKTMKPNILNKKDPTSITISKEDNHITIKSKDVNTGMSLSFYIIDNNGVWTLGR